MRFVLPSWQPYTDPDRRYAKARACIIDNMVQKMETEMRRQDILHGKMKGSTDCQFEVEVDITTVLSNTSPTLLPLRGTKKTAFLPL